VSNWLPISSAPKTGKRILLFADLRGAPGKIITGRYSVDAYRTMDDVVIGAEEGFQSDGDECIPSNQEVFTHWRPLPDPPCSGLETSPEYVAEAERTQFRGVTHEPCLNCGKGYRDHIAIADDGTRDVCSHGPL
jgi:hypothetical protein